MNLVPDLISLLSITINALLTIFFFGAIPFCLSVIKKLTAIETTIKNNEWYGPEIVKLTERIHGLELTVARCPNCNKHYHDVKNEVQ